MPLRNPTPQKGSTDFRLSQPITRGGLLWSHTSFFPRWLYRATANGSTFEELVGDGVQNVRLPSNSPDGSALVYRAWNGEAGPLGLKIYSLTTGAITNLTDRWDTTPGWSPDGSKIVFSRNSNWTYEYGNRWYQDRYDVWTINPGGTEATALTTSGANDAHGVWTSARSMTIPSSRMVRL